MTNADAVFAGSIPALYDRYLGPLLFEPYAADLAARLADLEKGRVLEVAAGTGILTRALARSLPGDVEIVATDLNQPMVDFAAAQPVDRHVSWRQADALDLPFEDASFDAVVCQFGIMFFPDRLEGYREAFRVLKPSGRYLLNVWGRIEENEFAYAASNAIAALFPNDPPGFMARTPHGLHDTRPILEDLRQAGFTNIAVETVERRSRALSPRDPAIGFCQGSPLRGEIEARGGTLEDATETAAKALSAQFGDGPIEGNLKAHVVSAFR